MDNSTTRLDLELEQLGPRWVAAKDFEPGMVIPTSYDPQSVVAQVDVLDDETVRIHLMDDNVFQSHPLAGAWL